MGKFLDADGGGTAKGTKVHIWTYNFRPACRRSLTLLPPLR